jgi:riboflavin synthase
MGQEDFTVSVIPHTLNETMLRVAKPGDWVNVEVDMIGKYIVKHLNKRSTSTLTLEKLKETGFLG